MIVLGLPLWDCVKISLKMLGFEGNFGNGGDLVVETIMVGYGKWSTEVSDFVNQRVELLSP